MITDTVVLQMIGMRMQDMVEKYNYPTLDELVIADNNRELISTYISGVRSFSLNIEQKIRPFILRGTVVEVNQDMSPLSILVESNIHGEQYEFALRLHEQKWQIYGMQYLGVKRSSQKKAWLLLSIILLFIIGSSTYVTLYGTPFALERDASTNNDAVNDALHNSMASNAGNDTVHTDTMGIDSSNHPIEWGIDDLQHAANLHEYVLVPQSEWEHLREFQENPPETTHPYEENLDVNEHENDPHANNNKPSNDANDVTHTIHITSGMNGSDIAQLLADKGLARSAFEMEQLIRAFQAQTSIQTGTYVFEENDTYLDIIEAITGTTIH